MDGKPKWKYDNDEVKDLRNMNHLPSDIDTSGNIDFDNREIHDNGDSDSSGEDSTNSEDLDNL